jgi:glycosyltransferase involved in cell wall biosynthesis
MPRATPVWRGRLLRLTVTIAYYLEGIVLVLRTSPVLVHANDYNTMWIGMAAKLVRRSGLIYDCHELWPDRNGRPEWRAWLLACEALFVRVADAVITTSPGYSAEIARRYRVPPPVVVRNIPARSLARVRAPALEPSAPLAVYLGGLMPGRGLEQAIDALALATELRARLIGPGSHRYKVSLQRRAERVGAADRLEIEAAVSPSEVLAAIAGSSLGLMLIQPVCRSYELTLPNKLFEYAAAGLPILASDLPVIGEVVRAEQLGEVVRPDDVEAIAQAMRRLADPRLNGEVRARVLAFAERETWHRERRVLEQIYGATARS